MHWRAGYDYYDPYRQQKSPNRSRQSPVYQNSPRRPFSNEKKIGNIIIASNSKEKKKIFTVKSPSKEKKSPEEKPRLYIISNDYFVQKKDDHHVPPSHLDYKNKRLEIIPQTTSAVRKSPIKIIKKTPPKIQKIQVPIMINTTVTAPSSISSSVLHNFESNPDRLLENMTESKLSKVFKN